MIAALRAALAFYTRFPVGPAPVAAQAAHAAAPLAGVAVALLGTAVDALAGHVGLSPAMAAGLALASMTVATGGLHEDGLADSADGLGGRDRERRLAILRDSRIGPFGTLALLFSVGLRWSAVAGLPDTRSVLIALVAAQASSRALLPLGLAAVVPARPDGLAASIGRVPVRHVVIATALGLAALAPLGLAAGMALPILAALFAGWRFACLRLFGGQTGDTLGALQQGGEIAVLAIASVHFGGSL